MNRALRLFPAVLFVALTSGAVLAQNYPNRPVRIVVPFAAGGSVDAIARLISPKIAEALAQPVVVENRGGAGGHVGADAVAKAPPDGYAFLLTTPNLAVGPAVYRKLPFDAAKDFAPVTQLVALKLLLVAGSQSRVSSIKELIALAKSKPGSLNYGHGGVGGTLHLMPELLKLSAGIDIVGIPYKGDAPITSALMSGEVDVAVMPVQTSLPPIKAGRLRALGVFGARRAAALPDVPTIAEAGVPDVSPVIWYGLFAPAKTSRDIIGLIQREAVKALNMPDVQDRVRALALETIGSTPEEFDSAYKADLAIYARIVKEARIPQQD